MEYVNALNGEDADLANNVQNLKNDLSVQQDEQVKLQAKAAKALHEVQVQKAALDAKFAEAQGVMDDLNAKKARAEELVQDLEKKYKQELAALTGLNFYANGVLQVCPVGQPHAVYDGFGAPRYAGGYHPHAGNDIIAPQGTPIYAPFDGYAHTSSNTLGGYAEYVQGANGYVYNAHMMQPGITGQVHRRDRDRLRRGDRRHEHPARPLRVAPEHDPEQLAGQPLRLLGDRDRREPLAPPAAGLLGLPPGAQHDRRRRSPARRARSRSRSSRPTSPASSAPPGVIVAVRPVEATAT